MITKTEFDALRIDLSVKCKNGIDFITSASIVWALIAFVWSLDYRAYDKAILTFMVGAIMFPLAFVFSKIYKTQWKNPDNPLDSLGLILNFAQLFYFPFLFFLLGKMPEYFVMGYVIITGAHFAPYSWFYKTSVFYAFAGIISVGAFFGAKLLNTETMFLLPLGMSFLLGTMAIFLWLDYRKKTGNVS